MEKMTVKSSRLVGLACLCIGAYFTYSGWATLLSEGYYYEKRSFFFPVLAMLGLGMIVTAKSMTEAVTKKGSGQLSLKETPKGFLAFGALGAVAGLINVLLINGTISI